MMAVNTVGHLAEAAWHHPDLTVSYAWFEVRLTTHDAKGITDKDFELAKKIEEVIGWRPGPRWRARRHAAGRREVRVYQIRLNAHSVTTPSSCSISSGFALRTAARPSSISSAAR